MDVRRILPTLARLIAGNSPEFATALAVQLGKVDRVATKPVRDQIGPLLYQPLSVLAQTALPVIFIIDGLDELGDENEVQELLELIADFRTGVPVRFILTSRPEMHIRRTPITNHELTTVLKLHTIDPVEVQHDIHLYINDTLTKAAKGSTWFTAADVDTLVKLSGGLFIFASTALKHILDPDEDDDRSDRLHEVTSSVSQDTLAAATARLDMMYELVITGALHSTNISKKELERLISIIACILTSRSPLAIHALADLLKLKPGILRSSLRRLHAVVRVPESDDAPGLRTLHASFGDYLSVRAPVHVRIPRLLGHETLAHACLDAMFRHLHFNVSQSKSSYGNNASTRPTSITLSLEYACLQWSHHVAVFKHGHEDISSVIVFDEEIDQKFRPKFLSWLEVLSVLRKVGLASGLLIMARSTVKDPVLSKFLRDATSFVASSHEAIERSAPHIYLSALPFTDKTSLVYQEFSSHCTGLVTVDTYGISKHGGSSSMTLTGHGGPVRSVSYSPDGLLLASGSDDGTVRIWNTLTGEETLSPLRSGDGSVLSVGFSRNNNLVASGTQSGDVCIWNITSNQAVPRRMSSHSDKVNSVVFSPDGSRLASASDDKAVCLWNTETGEQLSILIGHTASVLRVIFHVDGEMLASISSDGTVKLWHSTTGQATGWPVVNNHLYGADISLHGDIVAGASFNEVILWRVQTGEKIAVLGADELIFSIQFSPDGRSLLVAHSHGLRVWALLPDPTNASWVDLRGHSMQVNLATFSPDGLYIASASDDGTIRIWSAASVESAVQQLPAHVSKVTSVAVSRDGTLIAGASDDESVRVWNARTGDEMLSPLQGHAVAISPDGRLIASVLKDHTVRLWQTHSGVAVGEPMRGHTSYVNAVTFSHDGGWLATASRDKTVRIWNLTTRQDSAVGPLHCHDIAHAVAFSLDDKLVAAGVYLSHIHLWRTDTGERLDAPSSANQWIMSLAFSPDSTRIVSSGMDNAARVWEVCTGQPILVLRGHTNSVRSVAWSFDGIFIGTGSEDCELRLWDAMTGALLATLYGHTHEIRSVAFTFDGLFIVSGSEDATIRKWDVSAACKPASERGTNPVAALASANIDVPWLVGPAGELLLWVPIEYLPYLQAALCTLLIGRRRIIIGVGDNGLSAGTDWTACWTN